MDWADSRDQKAAQGFKRADAIASNIPMGQPILVGHHSEAHARRDQERIQAGMRQGVESQDMAAHHRATADGIQHQLDRSIYSDDPDAPERLAERIAGLEAERDRAKRINAVLRKGPGWGERLTAAGLTLTPKETADLESVARHQPYYCKHGAPIFPPYHLSNLSGNIGRLRERLKGITARAERTAQAEAAPGGVLIAGEEYVSVTFAEKPERTILDALKAAGFHWGGGSWNGTRANLPAVVTEGG